MGFGFKRQPSTPAPSSTLAACAADYQANRHKRDRDSNRDDANVRAAASEAAASRTVDSNRRGRRS